jgi:hypothetical protein
VETFYRELATRATHVRVGMEASGLHRAPVRVPTSIDLGIFPANQSDESKNNRKDQQDVNETAHRVPGEQGQDPQQQQYDHSNSDHGFPSDGRRGTRSRPHPIPSIPQWTGPVQVKQLQREIANYCG